MLIDGQPAPLLDAVLRQLTVVEHVSGAHHCDALFDNWGRQAAGVGFLFFDRRLLDFGVPLQIAIGTPAAAVFDGRITALEAAFPDATGPTIRVSAEGRLDGLRTTRRTRTFQDVTDADVFRRVAHQHGLAADVDVDGPTHRTLAQVNQSDLAFVRERARAIDAEIWVEGGELHAQAHARRDSGAVTVHYGAGLREFSVIADLAAQRTRIVVSGWDVAGKAAIEAAATDAVVAGELAGRLSGGAAMQHAFGAWEDTVVHTVPGSMEEARSEAEARFKAMARRFVTGRGVADADPRIRVGARVELTGLGPLFSGRYYVTESRHIFDGTSGLRTAFAATAAGIGQ